MLNGKKSYIGTGVGFIGAVLAILSGSGVLPPYAREIGELVIAAGVGLFGTGIAHKVDKLKRSEE